MPVIPQKLVQVIRDYFTNKPIDRVWLFGSFARGDYNTSSDVDILVSYSKHYRPGLLGIVKITTDLEKSLGRKVDLVEDGYLYPRIAKEVETHKILIYERINS